MATLRVATRNSTAPELSIQRRGYAFPSLCIPESVRCIGSVLPGGWPEVMATNRALTLTGLGSIQELLQGLAQWKRRSVSSTCSEQMHLTRRRMALVSQERLRVKPSRTVRQLGALCPP